MKANDKINRGESAVSTASYPYREGAMPLFFVDTVMQALIVYSLHLVVIVYTLVVFFAEWLVLPEDEVDWCWAAQNGYVGQKEYPNPDYNSNPCFKERTPFLLFLNQMECDFTRRMVVAVFLGAAIGFERKRSDRPAGIRTMSLVCLGSCFYTMCSQMSFRSSTMEWDAARVSAAIPSGVGFLGAGLIWKGSSDGKQEVHGLTTAASVWLSAAVGVGAGGRLYVISVYCVFLIVFVLRLGPRFLQTEDRSFFDYASSNVSDYDSEFEDEAEADEDERKKESEPTEEPIKIVQGDVAPKEVAPEAVEASAIPSRDSASWVPIEGDSLHDTAHASNRGLISPSESKSEENLLRVKRRHSVRRHRKSMAPSYAS